MQNTSMSKSFGKFILIVNIMPITAKLKYKA